MAASLDKYIILDKKSETGKDSDGLLIEVWTLTMLDPVSGQVIEREFVNRKERMEVERVELDIPKGGGDLPDVIADTQE